MRKGILRNFIQPGVSVSRYYGWHALAYVIKNYSLSKLTAGVLLQTIKALKRQI